MKLSIYQGKLIDEDLARKILYFHQKEVIGKTKRGQEIRKPVTQQTVERAVEIASVKPALYIVRSALNEMLK